MLLWIKIGLTTTVKVESPRKALVFASGRNVPATPPVHVTIAGGGRAVTASGGGRAVTVSGGGR